MTGFAGFIPLPEYVCLQLEGVHIFQSERRVTPARTKHTSADGLSFKHLESCWTSPLVNSHLGRNASSSSGTSSSFSSSSASASPMSVVSSLLCVIWYENNCEQPVLDARLNWCEVGLNNACNNESSKIPSGNGFQIVTEQSRWVPLVYIADIIRY